MSSVTVNYKFSAYKVKVGPSTNLNEVLKRAVAHFKLNRDEMDTLGTWTLLHKDKEVTMDLPWRLLNLPAGCNFDLVSIEGSNISSTSNVSSSLNNIKIRFQVSGRESIVQEVSTIDDILETLTNIGQSQDWDEFSKDSTLQDIKLRVLSSIYEYPDIQGKNFQELGIVRPVSINVELLKSKSSSTLPSYTEGQDDFMDIDKETTPQQTHQLHRPTVYLPSSGKLSIGDNDDDDASSINDDIYDLSVEQARRYQYMLSKQTGNLGGPLMTRRMREEKSKETAEMNRKRITECLVRIKFPDRTYLEIAFKPEETMSTVYDEVAKNLSYDNLKFKLYQPHPHLLLECNEQTLADDLKFGLKNVILLETEDLSKKGPFLKESVLRDAKSITEVLRNDRGSIEKSDKVAKPIKHTDKVPKETKTKKALSGMPKWFKLGKK